MKTERGAKLLQHKIFSRVKWFRSCCVTTIQIALMYKRCIYVIHISRFSSKRKGCNKFFDYSSFIKQENLLIYYLSETVIGVKFCEFWDFCTSSIELTKYKDVKCWGSKVLRNHQRLASNRNRKRYQITKQYHY